MSSSEATAARRMALFYGQDAARLDRTSRISLLYELIEELEQQIKSDHIAHQRKCPDCRSGEFCFYQFRSDPQHNRIAYMRAVIDQEWRDAAYAARARMHPVDYRTHVDGFCRYWQNLRYLKFAASGWACEKCGAKTELQCHHRHYDSVGYEEPEDLMTLCHQCHAKTHSR
jgi:hypothetical protein